MSQIQSLLLPKAQLRASGCCTPLPFVVGGWKVNLLISKLTPRVLESYCGDLVIRFWFISLILQMRKLSLRWLSGRVKSKTMMPSVFGPFLNILHSHWAQLSGFCQHQFSGRQPMRWFLPELTLQIICIMGRKQSQWKSSVFPVIYRCQESLSLVLALTQKFQATRSIPL